MRPLPPLVLPSFFGFAGVALGAFGAHALRAVLTPEALAWWQTGVQYHLVHAVALLAISLVAVSRRKAVVAAWSLGIVLFSGSLYLLAVTGWKPLAWVTPLGGVAFLVGWGVLAWSSLGKTDRVH